MSRFILEKTVIVLPRQARDTHTGKAALKKRERDPCVFCAGEMAE
eukprot:COSAG06_NODE_23403_length_692_cov_161.937605_1_plen_44_part_01